MWTRQRRIGAVSSRATEGLNLPERQLSLLCNLTRTCLTWVWVSTPARPSAQNQFHIGHAENYATDLFVLCILLFIAVMALASIMTLTAVTLSKRCSLMEFSDIQWLGNCFFCDIILQAGFERVQEYTALQVRKQSMLLRPWKVYRAGSTAPECILGSHCGRSCFACDVPYSPRISPSQHKKMISLKCQPCNKVLMHFSENGRFSKS